MVHRIFCALILLINLSGCGILTIQAGGVFKEPLKYKKATEASQAVFIDIPPGVYGDLPKYLDIKDGSKIAFGHPGYCGAGIDFFMIILPIPIPVYFWTNSCEKNGFDVDYKPYIDAIGVSVQLKYNNQIYDPYFDDNRVKFKIENFKEFKKATDKALIIKKGDFIKELPFEWKIYTETAVAP